MPWEWLALRVSSGLVHTVGINSGMKDMAGLGTGASSQIAGSVDSPLGKQVDTMPAALKTFILLDLVIILGGTYPAGSPG